ncbi:MAG: YfiR family protein [Nitrospinales bacterium]
MKRQTINFLKILLIVFFLLFPLLISNVQVQAGLDDRHKLILKSGVIFNITKFIKWPDSGLPTDSSGNFNFCINGHSGIANIFVSISKKRKVQKRNLVVRRDTSLSSLRNCHMLFLGTSESRDLEKIIKAVKKYPILTISDTPGFAKRGVSINLVVKRNKIRFEINRKSISSSGLKVSSELLQLGILVGEEK